MVYIKLHRNDTIFNGANVERLKEFQRQQLFTDVILLCQDKLYHAHKMVITSASNHARMKILFPNLNYSTILMTGVSPSDVENLLCFLYAGEVWIPNEELEGFLKAANILRIDRIEIVQNFGDTPQEMVVKPEQEGVDTSRPFQNANQWNLQPRLRAHETCNVSSVSKLDQENVTEPVHRFSTTVNSALHNSSTKKPRVSFRDLSSNHQKRSQRLKPKFNSKKRGREPEKFRDEPVESEDVNSFIDTNEMDKDCPNSENYPMPTQIYLDQAMGEDSWKVFNFQNIDETAEEVSNDRRKIPLDNSTSPQLQLAQITPVPSSEFVKSQEKPSKLKKLVIVVEDCLRQNGRHCRQSIAKNVLKGSRQRKHVGYRVLAREKLRRKCKRDTLWMQKQKL